MATTTSSAPWADVPHALIATPARDLMNTHACYRVSRGMVWAHNVNIRGLNAIVQQGPNIPTSPNDPKYDLQLIKDFLRYVLCWTRMTRHHHAIEEQFFFPELEKRSGQPGRLAGLEREHETFEPQMEELEEYVSTISPEKFRWSGAPGEKTMKEIIDRLAPPLMKHFHGEIGHMLGLKDLDSDLVGDLWTETAAYAKRLGAKYFLADVMPCALGNADMTYENGETSTRLPWFFPYLIRYWYALGDGAWRFNSCDFWGNPRPLAFGPGSRV